MDSIREISVQELKAKQDNNEDIFVLDVREPHEYEISDMGATLIPLGQLPDRLEEIAEHKNREVVVHCRGGKRSMNACHILAANGFTNPVNLEGGINKWAAEIDPSLPVY